LPRKSTGPQSAVSQFPANRPACHAAKASLYPGNQSVSRGRARAPGNRRSSRPSAELGGSPTPLAFKRWGHCGAGLERLTCFSRAERPAMGSCCALLTTRGGSRCRRGRDRRNHPKTSNRAIPPPRNAGLGLGCTGGRSGQTNGGLGEATPSNSTDRGGGTGCLLWVQKPGKNWG